MTLLATKEIERLLGGYGFVPTPEYCDRVRQYIELLLLWNRRVSLTAIRQPMDVLKFHFGESLMGIEAGGVNHGRLADVGSGAGFPGVPIAMSNRELEATLIESNSKKAAFLAEVIRKLDLKNVRVWKGRAGDVSTTEKFDFVTARAVGRHKDLLDWAAKRLGLRGKAVLWLSSEGAATVRGIEGWSWSERLQMPQTKDRFVVVGTRLGRGP